MERHPVARGFAYLAGIQSDEGSWKGDYDGPLFLLPGYIFAHYATRIALPREHSEGFVRYIRSVQNRDGGFGLHLESPSYLFTTVLNYVALRLLGLSPADPVTATARAWILDRGGALGVPSWGKYWLSILRLYEWRGVNPVLPELWLLPEWFPFHPRRFWCHCRVVYLAVSYLYGRRWQVPDTPLLAALRDEIYDRPYARVDFARARNLVAPTDLYAPPGRVLKTLNRVLSSVEPHIPGPVHTRALAVTLDHIKHEQLTTDFIDLGPVNKAFDVVATFAAEPESTHTRRAIDRLPSYLFDGEAGLTMGAYNSSELWDTALVALALADSGQEPRFEKMAEHAYAFVDASQAREDVPDRAAYYRDPSRGGWPFSNRAHGWPISDCTALGLMAALRLRRFAPRPIPEERLVDAVDLLLGWQNRDGGWPTYERNRGSRFLERLNPSEIFADVMTDHSHVELTSSVIQGLVDADRHLAGALGNRRDKIQQAIGRGVRYLRRAQRDDGSWEGAWGICFTYGTWWGTWGLLAHGALPGDPAIQSAVRFLCAKQLADGGWGESYESCVTRRYVQHPEGGQIVMTAWALLTLLKVNTPELRAAIARGVRFLVDRQLDGGDWPRAGMTGVFNRTCMLNYRFYRNSFPLWALALAERQGYALDSK